MAFQANQKHGTRTHSEWAGEGYLGRRRMSELKSVGFRISQLESQNADLLAALKEMDRLYTHWWDLADENGAITLMPSSVEQLEDIHARVSRLIRKIEAKP